MKVTVFSSKPHDVAFFDRLNAGRHQLDFLPERLTPRTAPLARGAPAVCVFVHDEVSRAALDVLAEAGVKLIALRCAGFNNVDLRAASDLGIAVVRVPAYSPHAVAEHAAGLILTLNRKYHRAYARIRERNFSLDGLMGFDLHGRTVGVLGTGKIGLCFARIMHGFGCKVVACDTCVSEEAARTGIAYVPWETLLEVSDIISLQCPLTPQTRHIITAASIARMKPGVMLINTSRGGLIDTPAVVEAVKSGQIGALGLDVYEEEEGVFYEDLSEHPLNDDVLVQLLMLPNVVITSHQAFFTRDAVLSIAQTTLENLTEFQAQGVCTHAVKLP